MDCKEQAIDISGYSEQDLTKLAEELREQIISVCASNGGHIAPSLGTVELTLALLKVFNPAEVPMVWDVGHQSYAYKILTGRKDRFHTLRKLGGISGFNNIFESDYDAFSVGHSSTSISAALGLAVAHPEHKTIAIIGDGALTGGMAFEGINHIGDLKPSNLIVILNDNQMSISPNVGGMHRALTDFLVSKSYNFLKKEIYDLSKFLPGNIRSTLLQCSRKMEESLLNMFSKNIFFEDFGFNYVGPVNGHNLPHLIKILSKIDANVTGPVLLHVITKKGKGYSFAEKDPESFHGIAPFNQETGEILQASKRSFGNVLGDELEKIASEKENVCAVVAAMSKGVGLDRFAKKFPERFYDVGIAEQHAVTFAAGLARGGKKPFVAIYSTFLQRAFDQLVHDVAMQKLPVVICLDRAGLVGADGATHHGVFDLAYLKMIPNFVVLTPFCEKEFVEMLDWAADYCDGPVAIRYSRGDVPTDKFEKFALGKAVVEAEGTEVAICSVGNSLTDARALAEFMTKDGIKPKILHYNCIKPFDYKILDETLSEGIREFITIEDGVLAGGFGETISGYLCGKDAKVFKFGYADEFVPHGTVSELKDKLGLMPRQIYKKFLQGRKM